jgi:NitT/TauT family transport system substrate-binding protein
LWGLIGLALLPGSGRAQDTLRIGALKFGTVNWELNVISHHGLDVANGFVLEAVPYGGDQATKIALQGGEVDGIVSDWLWVSRQRNEGRPYVMVPYSSAVGAIILQKDSPIRSIADLEGKRIGVAGGPLDKSWLLLRGLAERDFGFDPQTASRPAFGAPPLLSQKLVDGELDAVINYWHHAARLEASGYPRLMGIDAVMAELGVDARVPALGYVFAESFVAENPALIAGFAAASREAKAILATSDAEWERLRELTGAADDAALRTLQARFVEGIPPAPEALPAAAAGELFAVLAALGGADLVGPTATFAEGTFWTPPVE